MAGICEDSLLDGTGEYFVTWEYFLFRPDARKGEAHAAHEAVLVKMENYAYQLIEIARRKNVGEKGFFTELLALELEPETMKVVILEMLLTGTDTSSTTLYYALLGLGGKDTCEFKAKVFKASLKEAGKAHMVEVEGFEEMERVKDEYHHLLEALIFETARLKPLGAIILRQAVEDTVLEGEYGQLTFPKGMGVILDLDGMNRLSFWEKPDAFYPERNDFEKNSNRFFPFGHGPKGWENIWR